MKIIPCVQGSAEWLVLRSGKVTASEMDNLISPTWEIRDGEKPARYLAAKVAETWLGGPLAGFSTWDTEQGKVLEREAFDAAQLELNQELQQVGFITGESERVGCSPDAFLPGQFGVEIKCLQPIHHVSCLLKGGLPKEFAAQVHGSMYVTGLHHWKLYLYSNRFPCVLIGVDRDESIQEKIGEAVEGFLGRLTRAVKRLEELNAGPAPERGSEVAGFAQLITNSEALFDAA